MSSIKFLQWRVHFLEMQNKDLRKKNEEMEIQIENLKTLINED